MSLLNRVREAAGGARWTQFSHFKTHFMLEGSVVAPLERAHSFKELVAEGDVAARSVRISGFSDAGGVWGFHPDFVTIQRDDGGFLSTRREAAPRAFLRPKDEVELVYLCGLSIWSCLTAPLTLFGDGAQTEELGAWAEHGQTGVRVKVTAPEGALAYAREMVMYFDEAGMLRRTDFDLVCGETVPIVNYSSAHESFSGLTVPTLHRALQRAAPEGARERPLLDIEIFDVAFA